MAGLACSQMLSSHFDKVLLLERDNLQPASGGSAVDMCKDKRARRGVSQYNQIHAMTAQGLRTFDSIFNGRYVPALRAAGGNIVDMLRQFMFFHPTTGLRPWARAEHSREPVLTAACSRQLLESTARQLVTENERVSIQYGATAAGLVLEGLRKSSNSSSSKEAAVTGVVLDDGSQLPACLVVDCSGRGSPLPGWLAAAGLQRPRVSRASCNTGYAGWLVRLAPHIDAGLAAADVHGVAAVAVPPERTFSLIMRLEGGLWMASVGGHQGVHPERDEAQLLQFARERLWHPGPGRLLAGSTMLAPPAVSKGLSSTWRHYEEIDLPEGLLVLGDSICSFSPVYGQGMTVAAQEISVLHKLLLQRAARHPASFAAANKHAPFASSSSGSGSDDARRWLQGLPNQLQRSVLPTVKDAWRLSVGNDSKFEGFVSNDVTLGGLGGSNSVAQLAAAKVEGVLLGYLSSLFETAAHDPAVFERVLRVVHLLDQPQALLHPSLLLKQRDTPAPPAAVRLPALLAVLTLDCASCSCAVSATTCLLAPAHPAQA
ncbi:hypothetical protein OEZ86_000048 [Tetradesmus obliquus]|nr:hypothetical protein OEZ86_000048 [Tetradesmus obliquus]